MATAIASQQQSAPEPVKTIVYYLRNKASVPTKPGILNGRRAEYFKGKYAVKALLAPGYKKLKNVPPVNSEKDAINVLSSIIPFAFYLKVERGQLVPPSAGSTSTDRVRAIRIEQSQDFNKSDYFVWLTDPNPLRLILMGVAMVAVVLAGVMFPLWPVKMRIGVWYLSMGLLGLLGLFFFIAIFRLIFYSITVFTYAPGIWIFPNLFADVGFVDSFIPGWEWDGVETIEVKKKSKKSTHGKVQQQQQQQQQPIEDKAASDAKVAVSSTQTPSSSSVSRTKIEEVTDDN